MSTQLQERATTRPCTILLAGSRAQLVLEQDIRQILAAAEVEDVIVVHYADTTVDARTQVDMIVMLGVDALPAKSAEERRCKRMLRALPYKTGMVIAYSRDAALRRILKGFSYRMRWIDESKPWPGIFGAGLEPDQVLARTAAARVAHELGVSQTVIRHAFAAAAKAR